jgi:hypothetical protein
MPYSFAFVSGKVRKDRIPPGDDVSPVRIARPGPIITTPLLIHTDTFIEAMSGAQLVTLIRNMVKPF